MKVMHLIRYKAKWCDYPGYEYTGYCGVRNDCTQAGFDAAFTQRVDNVDCEECLGRYAMEQLANA